MITTQVPMVSAVRWPRCMRIGLLTLLLTGCQQQPVVPPKEVPIPTAVVSPPVTPADRGEHTTTWRIVDAESVVDILVYRGGRLAQLGHNHVVRAHELQGEVLLNDSLLESRFALTAPYSGLSVDEPLARQAAGADFASVVSDDAREGTRRNMLKPTGLDGDQYSVLQLRSGQIEAIGADYRVQVWITIRDQTKPVWVTLHIERGADRLAARGEFRLLQSDFGMTPYSVALGALQVLDELTIRFDLVARPA